MGDLKDILGYSAYLVLVITACEVYLTTRKLWQARYKEEVINSISLSGKMMGLLPVLVMGSHYAMQQEWQGLINCAIWLLALLVQLSIATGLWLHRPAQRHIESNWQAIPENA